MTDTPRPAVTADQLVIAGLTPLSTCDWPGHLAATVFLQGCPLACGYCHNPELIDPTAPGSRTWAEVVALLDARRGLLDGVVFSGGEPTRQTALADAMSKVKGMGFKVGLHTSGAYPAALGRVLPSCDWVGLDIKAPPHLYSAVTGVAAAAEKAWASLRACLRAGVDLQVRTTYDRTTMTDEDIESIRTEVLALGVEDFLVQEVRLEGVRQSYRDRVKAV